MYRAIINRSKAKLPNIRGVYLNTGEDDIPWRLYVLAVAYGGVDLGVLLLGEHKYIYSGIV